MRAGGGGGGVSWLACVDGMVASRAGMRKTRDRKDKEVPPLVKGVVTKSISENIMIEAMKFQIAATYQANLTSANVQVFEDRGS